VPDTPRRLILALCSTLLVEPQVWSPISRTAQQTSTWYEILRAPTITAYLDTGRIERPSRLITRVWFRFVYPAPITIGDDTVTHYRATEAREELDCHLRRARDLELRLESVQGAAVGSPIPGGKWQPFDKHPLGSGVFLVACKATGSPVRKGGA
jgi:hypothetical protein